jgi:hypothetical protein
MTDRQSLPLGTATKDALGLAGFALGHAAWSLEDGPGLVPIGLSRVDGETSAQRFATEITDAALPELRKMVASKVGPGDFGVLAFESQHGTGPGQTLDVINVHIVDSAGDLIATVRQAFRPAQKSRIPGRSQTFTVIGTPVPSDEIDVPGTREAILLGVMTHPQGARLFPQLAGLARELIAAMNRKAGE